MVIMQKNRILLVQSYTPSIINKEILDLKEYRKMLLQEYPFAEKWIPEQPFNSKVTWPDTWVTLYKGGINTTCEFLAANLSTPSTVVLKPINPQLIQDELKKGVDEGFPYTHVGFTIYVNGYTKFIDSARAVKKFNPNIITIAGNVGATFEQTKDYVDHVHIGDGVTYLRELLGENPNEPFRLKLIPTRLVNHVAGMEVSSRMYHVVTKLGCPNRCEFCATYSLFKGKCTGELFTPEQVHDALVEKRSKDKKDFLTTFSEPTAIVSKEWWYRLFDLFKDDPGDYPIVCCTTARSFEGFDLDRMRNSALRISTVNMGVESFSTIFGKNYNLDLKKTIARLHDNGIAVFATFIIGFDHHTHENVWQEIKQLVDIDAEVNSVMNLRPLPMTQIWDQLKAENRLIPLPADFYYIVGFQSYLHPHFKPGFEDILPLLTDVNAYIQRERGFEGLHMQKTFQNIPNLRPFSLEQIKMFQMVGELLYSSWENHLKPSPAQQLRYKTLLENSKAFLKKFQ